MAASDVLICNMALQKVGGARITSLTQDSKEARECNACFEEVRDQMLRSHTWNFSKTRVTLAPSVTDEDADYIYTFNWPADAVRILPPNDADVDWQIEGRTILTNWDDELDVIYVKRVTDAATMDPLFREAFACKIAMQICEPLAQSGQKKEGLKDEYKEAMREAKRVNAYEQVSAELPEDDWVSCRA